MVIYKLTFPNNKIYIGQTINFKHRMQQYKSIKSINKRYVELAFLKYGFDNVKKEIIYTTDNKKDLNEKEIYFIQQFNSTNRDLGYNISQGGESGAFGYKKNIQQRHARSKFTEKEVEDIKIKLSYGISVTDIAKEYATNKTNISNIKNIKIFEHIRKDLNDIIYSKIRRGKNSIDYTDVDYYLKNGYSVNSIIELTGISKMAIYNYKRKVL